jgi:hypothetical protein
MFFSAILCLLMAMFGLVAYRVSKNRLPFKRERLSGRNSMSVNEIYNSFYSNSGLDRDKIIGLLNLVATTMKLDVDKLRPTDRFKEDLGPVKGYPIPDELEDLEEVVYMRCKELDIKRKQVNIKTLDDFIRFMITGNIPAQ